MLNNDLQCESNNLCNMCRNKCIAKKQLNVINIELQKKRSTYKKVKLWVRISGTLSSFTWSYWFLTQEPFVASMVHLLYVLRILSCKHVLMKKSGMQYGRKYKDNGALCQKASTHIRTL